MAPVASLGESSRLGDVASLGEISRLGDVASLGEMRRAPVGRQGDWREMRRALDLPGEVRRALYLPGEVRRAREPVS